MCTLKIKCKSLWIKASVKCIYVNQCLRSKESLSQGKCSHANLPCLVNHSSFTLYLVRNMFQNKLFCDPFNYMKVGKSWPNFFFFFEWTTPLSKHVYWLKLGETVTIKKHFLLCTFSCLWGFSLVPLLQTWKSVQA